MKKLIFAALVVMLTVVVASPATSLTGVDTFDIGADMLTSSLAAARETLTADMAAGDVIDGVTSATRDAVYDATYAAQRASLALWEIKNPSTADGGRVFIAWTKAIKAAVLATNAALKCRRREAASHYAKVAAHAATAGYRAAAFVGHPAVFEAAKLADAMTAFAKAVGRGDIDAAAAALTSFIP